MADLKTGSHGKLIANDEGTISSIALSPTGLILAFQTDASTVKLLDVQNWKVKYTFGLGEDTSSGGASFRRYLVSVKSVQAVGFSQTGNTVAGEIEEEGIKLWDTRTGEVKRVVAEHESTGSLAGISTNGSTAAEVSEDQRVRVWNVDRGDYWSTPKRGAISMIGLSGDGRTLAVAYPDQILIFNNSDHTQKRVLEGIDGRVTALAVANDGQSLAAATEPGSLKVWDLDSGKLKQTLPAIGISALRFAPGDRVLVGGATDGHFSLWDLANGTISFELKKHSAAVNAVAFSADGKLLASGGDDRSVIIWEVATGRARRTLKGHDVTVSSLAFSADGDLLAVGSGNASVVLWDVNTGRLDRVLK